MRKSLFLFLIFGLNSALLAQKATIQRMDAGQFNFAKGEIQVSFKDTISPSFVQDQFSKFGYEIIEMNISPIRALIYHEIPDSTFNQILRHPSIQEINTVSHSFPEKAFQDMLDREDKERTEEEIQALRKRFEKMIMGKNIIITFKYDVNEAKAETFREEFQYVKMNLFAQPRSAIVKTEVGEEYETIKEVNLLMYVTGAALIAIADKQ